MTHPKAFRRDVLHEALGSPAIKPSMTSKVEMAFEAIEEASFEDGVAFGRLKDNAAAAEDLFLDKVLEALEKSNGVKFDRERIAAVVAEIRFPCPF